jgi:hypothetical protein
LLLARSAAVGAGGGTPSAAAGANRHDLTRVPWQCCRRAVLGRAANPRIRVNLVGKGSLEAASAILDGSDRPALWSPADSLVANLLAADWQTKNQSPLFPTSGDAAPQPLLLTPLVFAVWEERAKVLVDPSRPPRRASGSAGPTPRCRSSCRTARARSRRARPAA